MPFQCRPPCETEADCTAPTAALGGSASCDEGGGECYAFCSIGGFIADCLSPYVCRREEGSNAGYCALP